MTYELLGYPSWLEKYEQFLKQEKFSGVPDDLYDPMNYILSLGGKRVRPVLVLLAAQSIQQPGSEALHLAHAVELFHNFSLIHDDSMDQAPLRRSLPTVHHKWNIPTAILSGDLMLVKAYEYLLKSGLNRMPEILNVFNRVATGVCEGQALDMEFEQKPLVSIGEYLEMIRLKTAVLIGGAMELGALSAGASAELAQAFYHYGEAEGICFQILDDYLDAFGDESGKQKGGDIQANKKTILYLKALELSDEGRKAELQHWYSRNDQNAHKVKAVTDIFQELNIGEEVLKLAYTYHDKSTEIMKNTGVSEDKIRPLTDLTEKLKHRNY